MELWAGPCPPWCGACHAWRRSRETGHVAALDICHTAALNIWCFTHSTGTAYRGIVTKQQNKDFAGDSEVIPNILSSSFPLSSPTHLRVHKPREGRRKGDLEAGVLAGSTHKSGRRGQPYCGLIQTRCVRSEGPARQGLRCPPHACTLK